MKAVSRFLADSLQELDQIVAVEPTVIGMAL
jgi:hypothetical protein